MGGNSLCPLGWVDRNVLCLVQHNTFCHFHLSNVKNQSSFSGPYRVFWYPILLFIENWELFIERVSRLGLFRLCAFHSFRLVYWKLEGNCFFWWMERKKLWDNLSQTIWDFANFQNKLPFITLLPFLYSTLLYSALLCSTNIILYTHHTSILFHPSPPPPPFCKK